LIEEAERLYPVAEIGCLVSIGTGVQQGLRLAAEGTVRTNMFVLPFLGKIAARLDASLVAAALATSSEHIHLFAQSKFRGTEIYYRFNVCTNPDIKLFEHQKMGAMIKATEDYLGLASTAELIQNYVSRLKSMPVDMNSRDTRRTFSNPNDIQSLIESTINPAILDTIQQQPVETTWDIAPENLLSETTDCDVIRTVQMEQHMGVAGLPIGHIALSFNVLNGGQLIPALAVHLERDTCRRHQFQPHRPVHIPNGRWRSAMAYMLVIDITDQRDTVNSSAAARDWRMSDSEGCIMLGISVYVKREDPQVAESEHTKLIHESATISVPVPESCVTWALLESGESFEVAEGDHIMFEMWWDPVNVSEDISYRSKLFFGGIR
jgi:hypothetical protein